MRFASAVLLVLVFRPLEKLAGSSLQAKHITDALIKEGIVLWDSRPVFREHAVERDDSWHDQKKMEKEGGLISLASLDSRWKQMDTSMISWSLEPFTQAAAAEFIATGFPFLDE